MIPRIAATVAQRRTRISVMPKGTRRPAPRPAARISAAPRSHAFRWHALALVLAAILCYANSLSGPFVFDDRGTIVDNRTIENLWSRQVLAAPRETPAAGRPVVNVSFALNYAFGERDVTGYHVVNVALHTACALLIFGILRRSMASASIPFAAALIWTVHPLATEAVNYVTQRTELMMALFYLLTLYASIRAHGLRRARWAFIAVAACALGMASKESMVSAPLLVAIYDRIFLFASWREALRARGRLYAGLAAGWLVLAALLWTSPRGLSAGFSAHDADAWTYLLNQTVMITRYLWLAIWPRALTLYYGWPLELSLTQVLPQALFVTALLAATAVALWRAPKLGFLGVWFFAMLAPTSSIVPIATEVGAERRMYLALAAVVVLAVIAWDRLIGTIGRGDRRKWGNAAALAIVVALLAAGTVLRNVEYRSSLRLAETSVERWPTPGAHSMLGTELAAAGRLPEAESHLRTAASVHPPAQYYLGTVLMARGHRAEAIDQFKAYLETQPPALDQAYLARGLLADTLIKERRIPEAERELRVMLDVRPDDVEAMGMLGSVLVRDQRFEEALPVYRRAAAARPNDPQTLGGLGIALASTGRVDEAIAVFQRAVEIDPRNAHARQNLQRALGLRPR